jgi:uncharacterized protein YraI
MADVAEEYFAAVHIAHVSMRFGSSTQPPLSLAIIAGSLKKCRQRIISTET